jgi:hypothetical protein
MWHHVFQHKFTYLSGKHTVPQDEPSSHSNRSGQQLKSWNWNAWTKFLVLALATCFLLPAVSLFRLLLDTANEVTTFLLSIIELRPDYTALHPSKQYSSELTLWVALTKLQNMLLCIPRTEQLYLHSIHVYWSCKRELLFTELLLACTKVCSRHTYTCSLQTPVSPQETDPNSIF